MTRETTRDDLKSMTPEEISELHTAGALNHLLGIPKREPIPDRPTRADLKQMTPEEILTAREEGRLDHLLFPEPATIAQLREKYELTESGADEPEMNGEEE
ncbi:hypothetical protein [Agromyces sp. NPDC055658]